MSVSIIEAEREEGSAEIIGGDGRWAFSWTAALAGAFVALAVASVLIGFGLGVGLSPIPQPDRSGDVPFASGGGVYLAIALLIAFAAAGHIAGVLTNTERAARNPQLQGIGAWAIAITFAVSILFFTGGLRPLFAPPTLDMAEAQYWADVLFRQTDGAMQSSLAFRQYAQADNAGTDAAPDDETNDTDQDGDTTFIAPTTKKPPVSVTDTSTNPAPDTSGTATLPSGTQPSAVTQSLVPPQPPANFSIAADKQEAARILFENANRAGGLTDSDRSQIARLMMRDIGMTRDLATVRIKSVEDDMKEDTTRRADLERTLARVAAFWTAIGFLLGGIAAAMTASAASGRATGGRFRFTRREIA